MSGNFSLVPITSLIENRNFNFKPCYVRDRRVLRRCHFFVSDTSVYLLVIIKVWTALVQTIGVLAELFSTSFLHHSKEVHRATGHLFPFFDAFPRIIQFLTTKQKFLSQMKNINNRIEVRLTNKKLHNIHTDCGIYATTTRNSSSGK